MTQFNAKMKENSNRRHVVAVMHERGQLQVGKETLVCLFLWHSLTLFYLPGLVFSCLGGCLNYSSVIPNEDLWKLHGKVAHSSQPSWFAKPAIDRPNLPADCKLQEGWDKGSHKTGSKCSIYFNMATCYKEVPIGSLVKDTLLICSTPRTLILVASPHQVVGLCGWSPDSGLLWSHEMWCDVSARDQCYGRFCWEAPVQEPVQFLVTIGFCKVSFLLCLLWM